MISEARSIYFKFCQRCERRRTLISNGAVYCGDPMVAFQNAISYNWQFNSEFKVPENCLYRLEWLLENDK